MRRVLLHEEPFCPYLNPEELGTFKIGDAVTTKPSPRSHCETIESPHINIKRKEGVNHEIAKP